MNVSPVTLEGHRVLLRPMEQSHIDDLLEAGKPSEIWAYLPMKVQTREDMVTLVTNALHNRDEGRELPFVIYDKSQGRVVGSTRMMDISVADRHLEIGWTWLSPDVWRTRVNTECKFLLLRHSFENLGTVRVQLKTDGRNHRSQQAIERIGAKREGILRKHRILPDGYVRDSVYFSIIDTEWPEVKRNLEGILNR